MRVRAIQKLYSLAELHFVFPRFFNLAQVTYETAEIREIAALRPSVIIWDTLRKVQRLKTNDDDTPSFIYGNCQDMFPHTTHFFVHHDKKTQVDDHQLDPDEKFRGSGAWLDDADTGLHLSRVAHGKLLLTFTKTRSCEEQPPLPLSLHTDTLLLYATADQQAKRSIYWWIEAHPTGYLEE